MSIALTTGGHVWREGDGWSGMFWQGDTACRVPVFSCLGLAVGFVRGNQKS